MDPTPFLDNIRPPGSVFSPEVQAVNDDPSKLIENVQQLTQFNIGTAREILLEQINIEPELCERGVCL